MKKKSQFLLVLLLLILLLVETQVDQATAQSTRCKGAPFIWPTWGEQGWIWRSRVSYETEDGDYLHDGIDIIQVDNQGNVEPVYAVCDGLLIPFTNWAFKIRCDSIDASFQVPHNQVWVYYTHMANQNGSVSYVLPEFRSGKPSSRVSQGQLLGYQGNKGTGVVHLHLSVNTSNSERYNIDPSSYFKDNLDNNDGKGVIPTRKTPPFNCEVGPIPTPTPIPIPPVIPCDGIWLQVYNYPKHFVRHDNFFGRISELDTIFDRQDATFRIVPGLADNSAISIASVNFPGYFLRHEDFRIKLHQFRDEDRFRRDATFKRVSGLADGRFDSFESINYPGYFLRHKSFHLYLTTNDGGAFLQDATFKRVDACRAISLQSYNYPGYYVRHRSHFGELTTAATPLDHQDSSFRMVPGLVDGSGISFESVNYPGYFLRHEGFRIKLGQYQDDELFKRDATFKRIPGLAHRLWSSFESVNYPGYFLRHKNFHLYLEPGQGDSFNKDTTFIIMSPNGMMSLQSYNYSDYFVRHRNYLGELTSVSTTVDQQDATFRMVPGLTDPSLAVSFESVNYPGYFLRHENFRVTLQKYQDGDLFKQDATFKRVPGLANSLWSSFESYNFPDYYLRHSGFHLYLEVDDQGGLFAQDATFRVVRPRWDNSRDSQPIKKAALDSVTMIVPSSGGVVNLSDASIVASFPANAIGDDISVSIEEFDSRNVPSANSGFQIVGNVYKITATNTSGESVLTFEADIDLTLFYDVAELGTIDAQTLKLNYYDKTLAQWVELPSIVEITNNKVTGTTNHLTLFALVAPTSVIPTLIPTEIPTPDPSTIPEPATLLLFGIGLIGILALARKKRRKH